MNERALPVALIAALAVSACSEHAVAPTQETPLVVAALDGAGSAIDAANARLEAQGSPYHIGSVQYVTWAESGQMGRMLLFSNRGNRQLTFPGTTVLEDFVPGDPRLLGRTTLSYADDGTEAAATGGLTLAQTGPAIDRAMNTWDAARCSTLGMTDAGTAGIDVGGIQFLLGFGGFPFAYFADVLHAGWLPGAFFDALAPGGSGFILAATFSVYFIDAGGNVTDINGDGKVDVAFREIYYNNAFPWGIDSNFPVDVETIALHEAGHGLSQGHFGSLFQTPQGAFHFAPLAVMNAGYTQIQQRLTGTDRAGHCSLWGNWPLR